jgi:hypothetical protein
MNHIRLYDLFRKELHLTDEKAADAVYAVQEISEWTIASKKDLMATKEDIYSIKSEISSLIHTEINSLRNEINSVRKELLDSKDNIYRAIFLSGIVQFIAISGSLLAISKLLK